MTIILQDDNKENEQGSIYEAAKRADFIPPSELKPIMDFGLDKVIWTSKRTPDRIGKMQF